MNFMYHYCKNPKCGKAFIAEDFHRRMTPQGGRYCDECEAIGFPVIRGGGKNTKMIRKRKPKD